jgi:P27 family predicted phage terminase small subunit
MPFPSSGPKPNRPPGATPKNETPRAPPWLDREQRDVFNRIARQLARRGAVERCDESMLASYAVECVGLRQTVGALRGEPLTIPGRNGATVAHPLLAVRAGHVAQLARLASLLGLTAGGRRRAGVAAGAAEEFDPTAEFVREG